MIRIYCCLVGILFAEQASAQVCQPAISDLKTVVTAAQRAVAGGKTVPPISDEQNGFAWPDSEFGVLKTAAGYTFFASDGGHHNGNNKYGSVTRTIGTLDQPLGTAPPVDVIIIRIQIPLSIRTMEVIAILAEVGFSHILVACWMCTTPRSTQTRAFTPFSASRYRTMEVITG